MRKRVALVLVPVLLMCLWGCHAEEEPVTTLPTVSLGTVTLPTVQQTEPSVTEPSQPAEPEQIDPQMFVGQWKFLADSVVDTGMTFTINEDGTLIKEGRSYKWEAEQADPASKYEVLLRVQYDRKPGKPITVHQNSFLLYLDRTLENTYIATLVSDDQSASSDFYRVSDYEILELTAENMMEYMQCTRYFTYSTTDAGYTSNIYCYTRIGFREGVGQPSFCQTLLQYAVSEVEVTFEEKPSRYSQNVVLRTYEDQPQTWGGQITKVTGRTPFTFSDGYEWPDNKGGSTLTKIIRYWELTGGEQVFGRVYIPIRSEPT